MNQAQAIVPHIGYLFGSPAHVLVLAGPGTQLKAAWLTWDAEVGGLESAKRVPLALTNPGLGPVDNWSVGDLARVDLPTDLNPGW